MDWLTYQNQGAIRNKPISPKLAQAFGFLPELGISMDVFSGGQPEKGSGGKRTGSVRHDLGNSADVFFSKNGKRLDWSNPDDVPIYQDIVRRAKANGVTGFGAGENYMQPGSMHVGFGKPAVWGAGGRGANAPEWLSEAYSGKQAGSQTIANDTMRVLGKQPKGLLTPKATNNTESKMIPEEKPRGLLGSLGIQKMEEGAEGEAGQRFFERDTFKDTAANLAQGFAAMGSSPALQKMTADVASQRTESKAKNKTIEYLRANGRGDLADAVESGSLGIRDAAGIMFAQPKKNQTDDLTEYGAAQAQGYQGTFMEYQAESRGGGGQQYRSSIGKLRADLDSGVISQAEFDAATASKPDSLPTSIVEYEYAKRTGALPDGVTSFPEYEEFIAKAGRDVPDAVLHPTAGRPLSPMEIKIDENAAADFNDVTISGLVSANRNAAIIKTVIQKLGATTPGEELTGTSKGMLGEIGRNIFAKNSQAALNNVAAVVQQSLREILGGQFAKQEGEALIARAYNVFAEPSVNAARLAALYTQLQSIAENKKLLIEYGVKYGTTAGFAGQVNNPSPDFFIRAMEQAEKQAEAGTGTDPAGNGQGASKAEKQKTAMQKWLKDNNRGAN